MTRPTNRLTRRTFLGSAAAGGAILGLPAVTYRMAFAADEKPSDRIRIGCIGIGGQGRGNMSSHAKNVVAVCDVDQARLDAAAGSVEKASGQKPLAAIDYRTLLDRKDVDAVLVSTPDHWHALPTIHACQAGKDVYCEKPLTLFVAEGRAMVDAARKGNRVVQTGSQQRSSKEFRKACELVRNGAIGTVKTVKVGLPGPNYKGPPVPDGEVPKGLNYDLWLGPAPQRPYNEKRTHYLFRFFWDYSGGQQTNWGAHHLDIAQWGLGTDEAGPLAVEGTAEFNKDKWFETPTAAKLTYTYPNGVTLLCSLGSGGYPGGTTFEGDKGTVFVTRGKLAVTLNGEAVADPHKLPEGEIKLHPSGSHHGNWLDCIRTRKRPICDVEIGHRSATVCHLGNIAARTGRKLVWDAKAERITNDADANAMLSRPYREPWKLG